MNKDTRMILKNDSQLGPYPLEKLPKTDKITSTILNDERRPSWKEQQLARFASGEYGEKLQNAAQNLVSGNLASAPLLEVLTAISKTPDYPVGEKVPLDLTPYELSRHIKMYAYYLGAEQVGICRVPKSVMYTDGPDGEPVVCDHKYAVVFLIRKHAKTINASHGDEWIDDSASFILYQRLGAIATALSNYIRRLGYDATPSYGRRYVTLLPRLIAEAGLGEFSRMGIVVNPFIGASFKAACVLCDLPLEPDKPIDFGLQDYCEHCTICADHCPSHAIPKGGKTEHNGYVDWVINTVRCAAHCVMNPHGDFCQCCTKACPFNRPDGTPEQFKDWDGNTDYFYELVEKQRQKNEDCGYVQFEELTDKWWLPIREKDGKLQMMPEYDYRREKARMKKDI